MSLTGKKIFGPGRFFGINNISNPTPTRPLVPQDMSVDFKRNTKELHGEKAFAVDVAGGEMSVTGKVSIGTTNVRLLGELLFGDSISSGTILQASDEAGSIPGSTAYTIQTANHTDWTTDLGVRYADGTGIFQRVAPGSEAAGKYSVAAGTYTFAAADASKNVQISYLYSLASAGQSVVLTNPDQGAANAFTSVMVFPWNAEQDVLTLNSCVASDHGISTKGGDYGKPSFGFSASTDSSDKLGTFAFAESA